MAPHDTDTPTKVRAKWHIGPLVGMAAVLIFVAIAFFWWIGSDADETVGPETTPGEGQPIEPVE